MLQSVSSAHKQCDCWRTCHTSMWHWLNTSSAAESVCSIQPEVVRTWKFMSVSWSHNSLPQTDYWLTNPWCECATAETLLCLSSSSFSFVSCYFTEWVNCLWNITNPYFSQVVIKDNASDKVDVVLILKGKGSLSLLRTTVCYVYRVYIVKSTCSLCWMQFCTIFNKI